MNASNTAFTYRPPLNGNAAVISTTLSPRHQPRPIDPGPGAKKILLADDDPGVREMLGRLLESERYKVILARTGREAADRFVAEPPDLVLLDLNMPDRDGWAAFHLMNVSDPMLPVIVITARPNQYPEAVELGVDALMEKPLNLPVLLAAIKNLVDETQSERTRRLINPDFKTEFLSELPPPAHGPNP